MDSGYDKTKRIKIIDWAIVADIRQYRDGVIPLKNPSMENNSSKFVTKQGRVELVLPGELQSAIFVLINEYINHKDTELLENTDFTN